MATNVPKQETKMKRFLLAGSTIAGICLSLGSSIVAAQPAATVPPNSSAAATQVSAGLKPAEQCLTDLRAFDKEMQKDGYWMSGSGYGYGYPMAGYGYGYYTGGGPVAGVTGYRHTRPGYDIRTLVAAANILARDGQQQACEGVLAATRSAYKLYVVDMHDSKSPIADLPGWQQRQIDAAKPVTAQNTSIRSDQLVGAEVRNPQNEELGSVDDIVMNPQTETIAYLIIARGGIFGFDEKYVAVPWSDFKITPSATLLVLDTTKSVMVAGPQVSHELFAKPGLFDQESQKVDAYWKAHFSNLPAKTTR
jgi:sporulation protein YlmC with PRC-barrel domain